MLNFISKELPKILSRGSVAIQRTYREMQATLADHLQRRAEYISQIAKIRDPLIRIIEQNKLKSFEREIEDLVLRNTILRDAMKMLGIPIP